MLKEKDGVKATILLLRYLMIISTVTGASGGKHASWYKCFMCVLWIMTATTLMWSCQSHGPLGPTANASSTSGTNSSSAPTQTPAQLGDIRAVDFKNFTYPWYRTFLKSDSLEIKLQNGELAVELTLFVFALLLLF